MSISYDPKEGLIIAYDDEIADPKLHAASQGTSASREFKSALGGRRIFAGPVDLGANLEQEALPGLSAAQYLKRYQALIERIRLDNEQASFYEKLAAVRAAAYRRSAAKMPFKPLLNLEGVMLCLLFAALRGVKSYDEAYLYMREHHPELAAVLPLFPDPKAPLDPAYLRASGELLSVSNPQSYVKAAAVMLGQAVGNAVNGMSQQQRHSFLGSEKLPFFPRSVRLDDLTFYYMLQNSGFAANGLFLCGTPFLGASFMPLLNSFKVEYLMPLKFADEGEHSALTAHALIDRLKDDYPRQFAAVKQGSYTMRIIDSLELIPGFLIIPEGAKSVVQFSGPQRIVLASSLARDEALVKIGELFDNAEIKRTLSNPLFERGASNSLPPFVTITAALIYDFVRDGSIMLKNDYCEDSEEIKECFLSMSPLELSAVYFKFLLLVLHESELAVRPNVKS